MLESLTAYCFLIWLFFYKFKVIKFTATLKILSTVIGLIWLTVCWIGLERYTPSAEDRAFVQSPVVQLRPQSHGIVTNVFVKPNEPIKKGDPILQIDPEPYELKIKLEEAKLMRAEAELELAKIELNRVLNTNRDDPGAISQSEIDRKRENLKVSEASVKVAKNEIGIHKFHLTKTTVYAPADGYVVNLQVRPGLYIPPMRQPVISFVKSDESWIVAIIPQNGAAQVRPGNSAEVAFNLYPPFVFEAEVESVVWATGEAQGNISGHIPRFLQLIQKGAYVVKLKLKKDYPNKPLRFGSKGSVVINTGKLDLAWAVRKLEIRMISWVNLIL